VNLERHPNIHREGKESIQKVSEVYEFIWEIKEARKKIEKALKKTNKLRPYHRPTFTQQQETSLTVIMPSQESTVQEVKRIMNSRR